MRRQDSRIVVVHLHDRITNTTRTARQTVGTYARHVAPQAMRNRLQEVGL